MDNSAARRSARESRGTESAHPPRAGRLQGGRPSSSSTAHSARSGRRTGQSRDALDGAHVNPYNTEMVTRTIQIPDDVDAALERKAKASGRSVIEVLSALVREDEERERAVDEGRADVAAGRVVGNDAMKAWFATWGTDDEQDPPACPE
jgi:predicted transcriptional regulator